MVKQDFAAVLKTPNKTTHKFPTIIKLIIKIKKSNRELQFDISDN
jgi:hypothetical protein